MTADTDKELIHWIWGIKRQGAGAFLQTIADAALRADPQNYYLMRPLLLALKAKYPKYHLEFPDE